MASYNKIILMGNLTRDPQLSYTPANMAICKFGIATNRTSKDREGNPREEVCFVDCTLFGRGGEVFNQYMKKGQPVLVDGRLSLNRWTTPEGDKRSKHEVIVDRFTFVGGRGGDSPPDDSGRVPAAAGATGPGQSEPPPPGDDDIPF